MRRSITVSIILAGALLVPGRSHSEGSPVAPATTDEAVWPEPESAMPRTEPEAWTATKLPSATRAKLSAAFSEALARLDANPQCRQLFERLGADGVEVLATTLYYGATPREERRYCRGAAAFTVVGGRVTRVCRGFRHLAKDRAVVVLLHEALHHAGMSEKPRDPTALDSAQISDLVDEECPG